MKPIALRLMAVFAIVLLLGGPALSAHADTGASITAHPSIALRQTLAGTPQVEVIEPVETALPATEPPVDETAPQETAAPVQADATVAPTESVETLPPTTEPVETDPPVTVEPTEEEFIFVFCHVSPDGSQVTMRFSIDDPAGAAYFIVPAHGDAILLFPDDYWGECIAPSPTTVPPTEQPTQVTEVPTATVVPSQTAQPTTTATAPVETSTPTASASPTVVPGSPTPTATTDPGTPSPTATASATASPTATETGTVPAETPTTAPTETTVPVTATAPANTPTAPMEPTKVPPETPVQPTDPPTSQPSDNAQAPVQTGTGQGSAQSDTSVIDPVTGLPVAGSGPRDPHPDTTAIVSVLLMTAVALGYSAMRARRRCI